MTEKEIKAMISLLDDEDENIIAMISKKIATMGEEIIPFLETAWETSFNPLFQQRIEDLTHSVQYEQVKRRLAEWYATGSEDLLEGMWIVATYQFPELDQEKLRQDIEQIYYDTWLEFKPDLHPFDQVKILNSVFFYKLKFSGNHKNFHSPSNSFINSVLESRRGNPITLSVIYMLIARRLKLPIFGVNLPNLFVLVYDDPAITPFYINTFNRGLIFTRDDIANYIAELKLTPQKTFFEPCSNLDIIRRVLRNLVNAYGKAGEQLKKEEVMELMEIINEP